MADEHRRASDKTGECQIYDLKVELARMDEKLKAADKAVDLASESLVRWEKSANEWRQAINDERGAFVTRAELAAAVSIVISIVLLAIRFLK